MNPSPNKVTENETDSNSNHKEQEKKNQGYVVEKILDKRIKYDKVEYFLKWKDNSDTENSWEPIENLDCEDLIKNYEKSCVSDAGPPRGLSVLDDLMECCDSFDESDYNKTN
ncbi:heterochromatin protein 1-like [Rhopalosiphum maidis]|uniref:heterochromatin protein 1-like n=1 Tax=Rhopalosiphum maidis TaxID=43146 RepID=UPI000EFFE731|nr:heterochromatin protein 1-like [Rhopalosiphum maidis]